MIIELYKIGDRASFFYFNGIPINIENSQIIPYNEWINYIYNMQLPDYTIHSIIKDLISEGHTTQDKFYRINSKMIYETRQEITYYLCDLAYSIGFNDCVGAMNISYIIHYLYTGNYSNLLNQIITEFNLTEEILQKRVECILRYNLHIYDL